VKAGLNAWKNAGCSECHGAFADGERERDEAPVGANLRSTRLDNAAITEVIRCGRPNTGMPRFDEGAYTQRACNAQPTGPVPDALYPAPRMRGRQEIELVVTICGHASSDGAQSRRKTASTTTATWPTRFATGRSEVLG